jgi:hypothetical protein
MILHDKKIIFIHIPKTGGTSIENFFNGSLIHFDDLDTDRYIGFCKKRKQWLQHSSFPEIKRHYKQNKDLSKYLSFAFVRNPWDRAVSSWLWSKKFLYIKLADLLNSFKDLAPLNITNFSTLDLDSKFYENLYQDLTNEMHDNPNFKVEDHFDRAGKHEGRIPCDLYELWKNSSNPIHKSIAHTASIINSLSLTDFLERNKVYKKVLSTSNNKLFNEEYSINDHYKTQTSFIFDSNNNNMVDFIGRFESLNKDFSDLCNSLNIPYEKLPLHNKMHDKVHYAKYHNDHTKDLVSQIYKIDIENFGYTFN